MRVHGRRGRAKGKVLDQYRVRALVKAIVGMFKDPEPLGSLSGVYRGKTKGVFRSVLV